MAEGKSTVAVVGTVIVAVLGLCTTIAANYAPEIRALLDIQPPITPEPKPESEAERVPEREPPGAQPAACDRGGFTDAKAAWRAGYNAKNLDPALAVTRYRQAICVDPSLPHPYNSLGEFKRADRSYDEARVLYRKAMAHDPTYVPPVCNMGWVAHALGRLDEARTWANKALAINPRYPDCLRLLRELDGA